jgi:hypothetical protein
MSTIKISELNTFPALLKTEDFFPIDRSSSLLTYRATLGQLQTLLSTGSFSGSLIGTASWANNSISSSYALTSSYSRNTISASYAFTASYVSGSGGGVAGNGTVNYLPIWTGTTVLGDSNIYYTASLGYVSNYRNIAIENAQAFFNARGTFNCGYSMQSMYTASDGWILACAAENSGSTRGIFDLNTYSGSNQLINKQSNDPDGNGTIRALRISGNGFYFWPLTSVQSVSRDGTFNIGVDSGAGGNTSSRLLIDVFSGSSVSNPQTNHIQKAIEVRYGSSSLNTTFCVSSSGKTYVGGTLEVNAGLKLKSDTYLSITGANQIVSLNSEDYGTKYIELAQNGTASITMSQGGQLNVIVNQAFNNTGTWNANIYFTGSFLSSSGATFNCPIVWKTGTQPAITTGNSNRADFFTFYSVNTSNLGPKGSGATNNTVIYAVATQNMY